MNNFVLLFVIALYGTCTSSSNVEIDSRIAGGSPVTDHNEFSYMVSLQQRSLLTSPTRGHKCGGALVSLQHAVTAASCLFDSQNGVHTPLNPNDYVVFAGAIDLTNTTSPDRHFGIERFIVHPEYIPGTPYVNDIAVITLTKEISDNIVRTVALATNDNESLLRSCTSSGWGTTNQTNVVNTQLQYIQKLAMPNNDICQPFYNLFPRIILQSSMICASTLVSYSSCEGDLGNPLICNGNLQGILVRKAQSNCLELPPVSRPEIYTRISSFNSWITTTTAGASSYQPGMTVLAVIALIQIITTNVLN